MIDVENYDKKFISNLKIILEERKFAVYKSLINLEAQKKRLAYYDLKILDLIKTYFGG